MTAQELPENLAELTLEEIGRLVEERRLPPVDSWKPTSCGTSNIKILRDGSWIHEGRPIEREAMVRLFSSLLRRDADGKIFLVTPAEKLEIEVEDTPFLAVEMKSEGEGRGRNIGFRLNSGDLLIANADHPIRVVEGRKGPKPSVEVRRGLHARIVPSVYYELAELALAEGGEPAGVWSGGRFFALEAGQ